MRKKKEKNTDIVLAGANTYKPAPNIKTIVEERANKLGHRCVFKNGIVFFLTNDNAEIEKILKWLLKDYGCEEKRGKMLVNIIPFSYGFSPSIKDIQGLENISDEMLEDKMER